MYVGWGWGSRLGWRGGRQNVPVKADNKIEVLMAGGDSRCHQLLSTEHQHRPHRAAPSRHPTAGCTCSMRMRAGASRLLDDARVPGPNTLPVRPGRRRIRNSHEASWIPVTQGHHELRRLQSCSMASLHRVRGRARAPSPRAWGTHGHSFGVRAQL